MSADSDSTQLEFEYTKGKEAGILQGLGKAEEIVKAEQEKRDPAVMDILREIHVKILRAWTKQYGTVQTRAQSPFGTEYALEHEKGSQKGYIEGLSQAQKIVLETGGQAVQVVYDAIQTEMNANDPEKIPKFPNRDETAEAV
jgi:hypothetical protein